MTRRRKRKEEEEEEGRVMGRVGGEDGFTPGSKK